ncbi:MAG: hypothetical protein M1818_002628 [Claussenomyces sp. TS43310]|nr:MAG: hypothetical protein M1818_002628 [Claussenomyces sp. TS43310]
MSEMSSWSLKTGVTSSALVEKCSSMSPALLNRARGLAQEHSRLKAQTSETFDTKIAKRVGELEPIATALKEWHETNTALSELHSLLKDPTSDEELRELASEDLISTAAQLDALSKNLTTSLTPKHPFEDLGCLLEIRPGAGGGEAALFAADLLRMYQSYCSRKGLHVSLLKYEDTEGTPDANGGAPLAEAILEIDTPGSYGDLRSEAGVHRVQRVPATESKGRTHTSAVSVLVLPSFPTNDSDGQALWEADFNDPNSDYYVNPQDVKTETMRARGAGGQHVNKTDSAIRLTHLPTNTVVSMQESRSQHKNREKAWSVLRARLAQSRREAREEEMFRLRRSVIGVAKMGRGDKVRTYNWGQQRVTDHRSGLSVHNLDDVMEGGDELERIIASVKSWLSEREIESLIAEEEEASKKK